jgi:hypothetical protein
MSLLEKWRDIQFHKNLWKEDERILLKQAMIDGHEKGMAEGLTKGKLEIAKKMKNAGRPMKNPAASRWVSSLVRKFIILAGAIPYYTFLHSHKVL